mgnify:CR=1 FL=1
MPKHLHEKCKRKKGLKLNNLFKKMCYLVVFLTWFAIKVSLVENPSWIRADSAASILASCSLPLSFGA